MSALRPDANVRSWRKVEPRRVWIPSQLTKLEFIRGSFEERQGPQHIA